MVSVAHVIETVMRAAEPLGTERVTVPNALGRVLAEDVAAPRDIPPKDNSAMDGYALIAADTTGVTKDKPVTLHVIEEIPAGVAATKTVTQGTATRIMTGALIPDGADAVVPVEDTDSSSTHVTIFRAIEPSANVRYRGEDVRQGNVIIPAGTVLKPASLGMLASLGRAVVSVFQRPTVALISTGNELVDVDEMPGDTSIITSNSYSVAAQITENGGIPLVVGIARDDKDDILRLFRQALRADIVVSSAGVSEGNYDFVADVLEELGITIHFTRVAERPGKPMVFGTKGRQLFFSLPGNPVSSMMTFEQYVRPAILKMSGHHRIFRKTVQAVMDEEVTKKKGLRYFLRGILKEDETGYTVVTTGSQGSGILTSMVQANAVIVLPEEKTHISRGDRVTVQILDSAFGATEEPRFLEP